METTGPRFTVVNETESRGWGVHDSLTDFTAWWGYSGEDETTEWAERLNGDPDLYENLSWQNLAGEYVSEGDFADAVRAAQGTHGESPRFVLDTEHRCVQDTLTGCIALGLGQVFVDEFNRDPERVYRFTWSRRGAEGHYPQEEYRPVVEAAQAAANPTWETILEHPAQYRDRIDAFYDAWKAWRIGDGVTRTDADFLAMWMGEVVPGLEEPGNALTNMRGWLREHPEHIPSTLAPAVTEAPIDYADVLDGTNLRSRTAEESRELLEPLREVHTYWLTQVRGRTPERVRVIQEGVFADPEEHADHLAIFKSWLDGHRDRVPRLTVSNGPAPRKPQPWEEHFNSEDDWRTFYLAVNHRGNASEQCQVLDKLVKSMHGITRDQMGTIKRRVTLPELVIEVEAPFTAGNSHFGGTSVEQRIAEEVRRRVAQLEQERVEDNNPDPLPPHPLFSKANIANLTAEQFAEFEADLREFAALSEMATGINPAHVPDILARPSRWNSSMPIFGYWLRVNESTDPLGPFGHLFKSREAYFAYWKKAWKLAKRASQEREYAQIALMMGGPQADAFRRVFKVKVPADFEITIVASDDEEAPSHYILRDQVYTALAALQPSAYTITTIDPTF